MSSPDLNKLNTFFESLPGVGPKTAERFVFHMLKQPPAKIEEIIEVLKSIKGKIKRCSVCQNFSLSDPCEICNDSRRQKNIICVVAKPQDVAAIEKTHEFTGLYHLLDGLINAPDGIGPQELKIKELLARLKKLPKKDTEIILGLDATIEGETTALYLARLLKPLEIKVTRLARGLPQGSDLQYADEITLSIALSGRKEI